MDKIKKYLVLHLILFLYSLGGIFLKLASMQEFLSRNFILYYGIVIGNLAFYAFVWQRILSKMPLNIAYANKAVIIIWGMLWGVIFFNETITANMIIGSAIVLLGVILVVKNNGE